MTDDLTTSVNSGALVADKLQQLIDNSRKQFDLPPYVDPTEYEAWKQEKSDIITQQKTLHEQYISLDRTYTGRDRYLERLSTYSAPFISNTTPITADQCAMHGWIDTKERHMIANTEVYRLSCQQCSAFLDVPCLTGANAAFESVKRIYSLYPTFLNRNHSDVCFWHTTSCHISVCAFPLVTTTDAFGLLETQGKLFQRWGNELPVINTSFNKSKMRILHRIVKAIEGIDVFSFPQQQLTAIHETAYLLPIFGWHCLDEHNYRLLKCTCCFRHVLVPNYLQMNDLPTPNVKKSTQPSPRSECINGAFDPLNEHRPYCPWRNRDIARMNIKDSFFVTPKQPLNGCEWMLEIMCKEWFRLTTEDEKHPRHDEFRRNAERYLSTSIATNRWMTGDLTKYALSKSMKRTYSDMADVASTTCNQEDKRQHTLDDGGEKTQNLETKPTKDTSALDTSLTAINEKDIEREGQPSTHTPTQTASPLTTTPHEYTEPVENGASIDNPPASPSHQQLDLLQPESSTPTTPTTAAATTTEIQSQELDTKAMEALESSSGLEINSGMENEATEGKIGMDQVATVEYDSGMNNLGPSVVTENNMDGSTATAKFGDEHNTNELGETMDMMDTNDNPTTATAADGDEQINIPAADDGAMIETNDDEATLGNELDDEESKDTKHKEDYLLTPNGEGISTPTSWGLADTDSAMNALDEDENKSDQPTIENVDNGVSATVTLYEHPIDTLQNENGDLLSTPGDEGNMDVPNNDLTYDHDGTPPVENEMEPTKEQEHDAHQQVTQSGTTATTTATTTTDQGQPESELELEGKHIGGDMNTTDTMETDETGAESMEQMEMDQVDDGQQAKDTMELELDDLDTVPFTNTERSEMATANDNQSSEVAKVDESDTQLDNIATPQDMIDDNITTSQDINDDNMYGSSSPPGDSVVTPHDMNDEGEALGQDVEDGDTISHDMDTSGTAMQDMESLDVLSQVTEKVNVATPQDMVDHYPTTHGEKKVNQDTQDMQDYEPTSPITDDNETTFLGVHTEDNTHSLVAAAAGSTVNANEKEKLEQEGPPGVRTDDDLQQVELDDETGVVTVDQETHAVTHETENEKVDQQETSKKTQMVLDNGQDGLQTTDEQVEQDIGDIGNSQYSSTLLDAAQVTTEDDGMTNTEDATILEPGSTEHDEHGEKDLGNNETYLDENSDVELDDDANDNTLLDDEGNNNDTQLEDTSNHTSLGQHDNMEKKEINEDDTLLDQNNESSMIDTDNNQTFLDQQNTAKYDENATEIDAQDFYNNDQSGITNSPITAIDTMENADVESTSPSSTNENIHMMTLVKPTEITHTMSTSPKFIENEHVIQHTEETTLFEPSTEPSQVLPSSPPNDSKDDDGETQVVKNATDVDQELDIDGQETDNDRNATVDDHSTESPPFTTPGPDLYDNDDNDEDQLEQYKQDENTTELLATTALTGDNDKDNEPMLDQEDLMEE